VQRLPIPAQCPPACPDCQHCVNGRTCTPAADGATCQNNPCKVCQGGVCANTNGISCENSPCKECQDGVCVNKANDLSCESSGRCLDGTCNPRPRCSGIFADCSPQNPATCCSEVCVASSPPFSPFCYIGTAGKECIDDFDCLSGNCVGYRCL
jgi:hypothetical protein